MDSIYSNEVLALISTFRPGDAEPDDVEDHGHTCVYTPWACPSGRDIYDALENIRVPKPIPDAEGVLVQQQPVVPGEGAAPARAEDPEVKGDVVVKGRAARLSPYLKRGEKKPLSTAISRWS
jgi:hypothetical protein